MCPNVVKGKEIMRRLDVTLFDRRIVGSVPKVSQCPTLVRNVKAYEYISMNNI